jgi:mannobiose 2-epimerase
MEPTPTYRKEIDEILNYWSTVVFDQDQKLFYGRVDENNQPDVKAPLGSVMYARVLWSFSAGFQSTRNPVHLEMADYAYQTLVNYFFDKTFGGTYWFVDVKGMPLSDKKQIYGIAFAIYGLTAYYNINRNESVLAHAIDLYQVIEKYSYDLQNGGYVEAFHRDWTTATDLRLSGKDANEKKTMNTHLHILEAYTNLYKIWPDQILKEKIKALIDLFKDVFFNSTTLRFNLFMDEDWKVKSSTISYGHDIEATWLICEAAVAVGDVALVEITRNLALTITEHMLEDFNTDGSLPYEFEPESNHLTNEKHWWVQAEACVGLLNAWQLSGDEKYKIHFEKNWSFIAQYLVDRQHGEWFWGLTASNELMARQDKAGFWKCPYHNTRSLLEMAQRLAAETK